MNVTGWRDEIAHLPPFAAQVLRWMQVSQPDIYAESEEVASVLAIAWQELLDAECVAVWVDVSGEGCLELLGRAGQFDGIAETQPTVKATEENWPESSFFLVEGEGESRDLAAQLGLLSEKVASPSLCVPFDGVGIALFWLDTPDGRLSDELQPFLEVGAKMSGAHLFHSLRLGKLGRSFLQIGEAVADSIDARESHREGFSKAVSYYSGIIARAFGLSDAEAERIEYAGLWHGLGRLSIPDSTLASEQLTNEEIVQVRNAAVWGAQKLENVEGLEEIVAMIRHQNERYDGSGAPDGLKGDNIPLGSRILAVATRFAAMTNRRSDRAPMSVVGGAMDAVAQGSGTDLDPNVVQAFVSAMGRKL